MKNDDSAKPGICFLNPGNYIGGAEKVVFQVMRYLVDQDRYRIMAAGPSGDNMIAHLKKYDVEIYPAQFDRFHGLNHLKTIISSCWWFIKLVRLLCRLCHDHHISLLYANEIKVAFIAAIAGKLCSIPVIWHVHDFTSHGIIDRWCFSRVSRVVAVSHAVNERFRQFPDFAKKSVVVHNGIGPDWFEQNTEETGLRNRYGVSPETVLLGTAGRIAPEKCQHLFIRIVHWLSMHSPVPVTGFIAGDIGDKSLTGYKIQLEQQIHDLGLEKTVYLTGHLDDTKSFLDSIDIFILPSKREPFGLVTLETMARKKPVAAFRTGGTPEIIDDGVTGILFNDGEWESMAKGISGLINDPARREHLGKTARGHVQTHFSLEHCMQRIQTICEDVISS